MKRDGQLKSLWQEHAEYVASGNASQEAVFDVVIAGAGIAGLTTALLLQQQGLRCAIAEAQSIGFGTTLGTTAHLNNFFDTPYGEVSSNFGEANANLLYQGAEAALSLIRNNIDAYQIDCGYSDAIGYLFATNEHQDKDLKAIVTSGQSVGLPIAFSNENPFPIPYTSIATIQGQAKFNPAAYITGLANAFEKAGGVLLQQCRVQGVREGAIAEVNTSRGVLQARQVLYATHIPPGVNLLHFRCAPYRRYVLAVTLNHGSEEFEQALGYDLNDPYHYYRMQEVDGVRYLIAGGEDHKTGHEENTAACFKKLEAHVRTYFDVKEVVYKWSSQYFEPADGLPYIGHLPGSESNVFTATGFGGNGMIYGTLSGIVLSDMMVNGESEYQALFKPGRVKPMAGFTNFIKENVDVVKTFFKDKLSIEKINGLADLAPGEGRLVEYEGQSIGLYKDDNGQLHAVQPACPHVRCSVGWNSAEKTWDCPCHGSRFATDGMLLTGPAQQDLVSIDLSGTA